ncbi:UNVERIFIED_CONTAM: hypothetical protein PYX00_005859 [Menopon gallinae]|uniref:Uncharacterized protein n=1 Tax=Menopon gallinae TaxID=328185 RepID=A0AAW2HT77_9NEOP
MSRTNIRGESGDKHGEGDENNSEGRNCLLSAAMRRKDGNDDSAKPSAVVDGEIRSKKAEGEVAGRNTERWNWTKMDLEEVGRSRTSSGTEEEMEEMRGRRVPETEEWTRRDVRDRNV